MRVRQLWRELWRDDGVHGIRFVRLRVRGEQDENPGDQTGRAELGDDDQHLGDLYAESGQTLQGSFSAVSNPTFCK